LIIRDSYGNDITNSYPDNYIISIDYGTLTLTEGFEVIYDPGDRGTWDPANETYLTYNDPLLGSRALDVGDPIPDFASNGSGNDVAVDHDPGWRFIGWSPSPADYSYLIPGSLSSSTIAFVAQWEPIDYTVTYDANGGTIKGGLTYEDPDKYNIGDTVYVIGDEPERSGYIFVGWKYAGATYWYVDDFTHAVDDIKFCFSAFNACHNVEYAKLIGTVINIFFRKSNRVVTDFFCILKFYALNDLAVFHVYSRNYFFHTAKLLLTHKQSLQVQEAQ